MDNCPIRIVGSWENQPLVKVERDTPCAPLWRTRERGLARGGGQWIARPADFLFAAAGAAGF